MINRIPSLSNNLADFSRKTKILEKDEEFYHIENWRNNREENLYK